MSKLVSMRLDDDIVDLINAQEGKSFTDKFQRLVRDCQTLYSDAKARANAEQARADFYSKNIKDLCYQISCLKTALRRMDISISDFEHLEYKS